MESIRQPAVAGTFYPAESSALRASVQGYMTPASTGVAPKALIAPHAGFVYSGPVAGHAYGLLGPARDDIKRVVLLGPSHRVGFRGMALPTSTAYRTPLGDIPIDEEAIKGLAGLPGVGFLDQAHKDEHSLEVHLPFLQEVLGEFTLVPVVVGDAAKEDVAGLIEHLWGGEETLVVISSDLSHYHPYKEATEIDRSTADKITALDTSLVGEEACGCRPINGLLHFARQHDFSIEEIDLRNSGDTAGPRDRVVGYGAFRLNEKQATAEATFELTLAQRQRLLQLAREAIRSPLDGEKQFNVDLNKFDPLLREKGAAFITINIAGRLRGCIGSLTANRPLALDVAYNAQAAAFNDPRFSQLTRDEYNLIDVHISVLSPPVPMPVDSREDLINKLVPGKDGLIIKEGARQSTYLPSVWSQIPTPEQFVSELRRKAGLSPDGWSNETEVLRYSTFEFA